MKKKTKKKLIECLMITAAETLLIAAIFDKGIKNMPVSTASIAEQVAALEAGRAFLLCKGEISMPGWLPQERSRESLVSSLQSKECTTRMDEAHLSGPRS